MGLKSFTVDYRTSEVQLVMHAAGCDVCGHAVMFRREEGGWGVVITHPDLIYGKENYALVLDAEGYEEINKSLIIDWLRALHKLPVPDGLHPNAYNISDRDYSLLVEGLGGI